MLKSKFKPDNWEERQEYTIEEIRNCIDNKLPIRCKIKRVTDSGDFILCINEDIHGIIESSEFKYYDETRKAEIMSAPGRVVTVIPTEIAKSKSDRDLIMCSRKLAQKMCYDEYVSKLTSGDIIMVGVAGFAKFGMFCDIGCGIQGVLKNSRIKRYTEHIKSDYKGIKEIPVVVTENTDLKKIQLSEKEVFGTWEENVNKLDKNNYIYGRVVKCFDKYCNIELGPALIGIASKASGCKVNDIVKCKVATISPRKMKVVLSDIQIVKNNEEQMYNARMAEFSERILNAEHINEFVYSPNEYEYTRIVTKYK